MDLEEGLKGWMSMWLLDEGEGVVVHELGFATQQVAVATKKIKDLEKKEIYWWLKLLALNATSLCKHIKILKILVNKGYNT